MKTLKQILIIALAFTLCCFAFAGCGEKSAYFEITVTYEDGTLVNGLTDGTAGVDENGKAKTEIQVQLCIENGGCATPVALDEKGKCKIKISELEESLNFDGDLQVHLLGVKDNYTYDETKTINKDNPKIKIVLTEKN